MLDRSKVLDIIDGIYVARVAGDQAAMAAVWTDDASYQLMGDANILGAPLTRQSNARQAVSELIDQFKFHSADRVDTLIEGNRAAVLMRITVSASDGGRHDTHVFNLWEFDDNGKARSVIEFTDTALIMSMLAQS
ncbi:MAG: nuclear transport factor 2 family protein [Sphingorhabdus sp.]